MEKGQEDFEKISEMIRKEMKRFEVGDRRGVRIFDLLFRWFVNHVTTNCCFRRENA